MDKQLRAIHSQFDKLESKKREITDLLQNLPPTQILKQPDAQTWSVGQVAQHLYLSERNSLAYLKKKLSYPDTVPSYHPKSWGGVLMIKLVYLFGIKIKAPDSINMWKANEVMTREELKSNWDALRVELISFIEKNEPAFGRHLAFRHPFAGRMTMHQMLIFMNDHISHHQKQMQKILRRLNSK
jgi:uncharacterized damage-inducible protein DinB